MSLIISFSFFCVGFSIGSHCMWAKRIKKLEEAIIALESENHRLKIKDKVLNRIIKRERADNET